MEIEEKIVIYSVLHLHKPRVLSPLRFLRTCVRNEVDLVHLACDDVCADALLEDFNVEETLFCAQSFGKKNEGAICFRPDCQYFRHSVRPYCFTY